MSPRKASQDKDLSRGKRFAEIRESLFPDLSRNAAADRLGVYESRLRAFEKDGVGIDNHVLAQILELGGDVGYILTGKRTDGAAGGGDMVAKLRSDVLALEEKIAMLEERNEELQDSLVLANRARRDAEEAAQAAHTLRNEANGA